MKIKSHLRGFRVRRGISQADLARALGISRQAIHGFETARFIPSLEVAGKISKILDVPVSCIFCPDIEGQESPVALIADCASEQQMDDLAGRLKQVVNAEHLQTVVKVVQNDSCPSWTWDPRATQIDSGKPMGIAVACATKKQFDQLIVWFRSANQTVDCGIGIDRFPTVGYFGADWKYARESLPDWEPVAMDAPFDISEFRIEDEWMSTIQDALACGQRESADFATKCASFGHHNHSDHYVNHAKKLEAMNTRLKSGGSHFIRRWSDEYVLVEEALFSSEVYARNRGDVDSALRYLSVRRAIDRKAD